jgi:GntR family transcriptional regulator, galactonate operon transcriptional repressor
MDTTQTPATWRRLDRPQRFGDLVAEEVVRSLARGDYAPGDRLPTEPQLQQAFGVSRTVLREALKFVESRGMLSIGPGRGAVVQPMAGWNLLDPLVLSAMLENYPTPEAFEQLMAVRSMIEPELARAAADLITTGELERLAELLVQMADELHDPEAFLQHDVEFHNVINRCSGNMVAHSIMAAIEQPLRSSRRLTNTIPHALDQAQDAHQHIYDQLLRRDSDQSAEAMRAHLAWSRDQLLLRWSSRVPPAPPMPARIDAPG